MSIDIENKLNKCYMESLQRPKNYSVWYENMNSVHILINHYNNVLDSILKYSPSSSLMRRKNHELYDIVDSLSNYILHEESHNRFLLHCNQIKSYHNIKDVNIFKTLLTTKALEIENDLFDYSIESMNSGHIKFTGIHAYAITNKKSYSVNEEIEVKLGVSAYDSSYLPTILIGEYDSILNYDGCDYIVTLEMDTLKDFNFRERYTTSMNKKGKHAIRGLIIYQTSNGQELHLPFSTSIKVK